MKGGPPARPSVVRPSLAAPVVALLLLGVAGSSIGLGHEGGPRLILEPERVRPGGVLTIRVEDLPPERPVDLSIAGSAGSVPLASVVVDPEGHATVFVEVPVDLRSGRTWSTPRPRMSTLPARRSRSRGRPSPRAASRARRTRTTCSSIPLPSGWQQSLSGPIVTARPLTETLPAGSGSRLAVEGVVAAIAVALVLGSVAFVMTSRLRRRA